jgi:hypothetical protein
MYMPGRTTIYPIAASAEAGDKLVMDLGSNSNYGVYQIPANPAECITWGVLTVRAEYLIGDVRLEVKVGSTIVNLDCHNTELMDRTAPILESRLDGDCTPYLMAFPKVAITLKETSVGIVCQKTCPLMSTIFDQEIYVPAIAPIIRVWYNFHISYSVPHDM